MIAQAKTFADLVPNTMLGHYSIIGHVAEGGMGHVYRAYEASLQREVAIKVLKIELASNPAQLRAFAEEAQKALWLRLRRAVLGSNTSKITLKTRYKAKIRHCKKKQPKGDHGFFRGRPTGSVRVEGK